MAYDFEVIAQLEIGTILRVTTIMTKYVAMDPASEAIGKTNFVGVAAPQIL